MLGSVEKLQGISFSCNFRLFVFILDDTLRTVTENGSGLVFFFAE